DNYAIEFNKQNLPIVLVDSFHSSMDSFFIENKKGAYAATKHLIDLGHKRVGMIDAQLKSTPAKIRLEGYKSALKDKDIPFDKKYLVISDSDEKSDGFSREAGYSAMKKLLMLGEERPTAVFVSSDIQAVGAMKAIREHKLTVPDDIAIIGFDDIEFSEAIGLSTMKQPMFEMGKMAVEILLQRISGQISGVFHKKFIPELIIRDTC
ncbi:substrate-binding domain-containing protein, partial [bacterium]|nr:substrate-binding domain-containing protein [bacterium]